jgi:hypothetical protein
VSYFAPADFMRYITHTFRAGAEGRCAICDLPLTHSVHDHQTTQREPAWQGIGTIFYVIGIVIFLAVIFAGTIVSLTKPV